MFLSKNWLKDFIPADISVKDIADRLTMSGIEVEEILTTGTAWNNIMVGEILTIARHPNADKLSLTTVKAGDQLYTVVCGAPNIKEGQKIPLALEGARLPNGIVIKKSKIRGEFSEGMICSETELELGTDTSGIMVLAQDAPSGMPLNQHLGLADTILNLSITPNRADCLSVIGLAREIAALFQVPLVIPETRVPESEDLIGKSITVEIHDSELCPRYTARLVKDVVIKPSPLWMQQRLKNCGIRAINNIVDVTNYILLEWGQPLHAFDLSLLSENKIIVRKAHKGETFITLDSVERQLPPDALMICDNRRSVAIGGIMGGLNSSVSTETSSILIESAYFNPTAIGRTSRSLNLKTEASLRFEKGIDINSVVPSLHRAACLMGQLSGGKIAKGFIDVYSQAIPPRAPIKLSVSKMNKISGLKLSQKEIKSTLELLSIQAQVDGEDTLNALPPSFRHDLASPIDLIEEVTRITGYEQVPLSYPMVSLTSLPPNKSLVLSSHIRTILIASGFFEVLNYSFISPEDIMNLNILTTDPKSNPIKILNPISSAQSVMRTTLIPGLLLTVQGNINNACKMLKLFEIGKVFLPDSDEKLPHESKRLAGVLSGLRGGEGWNIPLEQTDFYDIKGAVEILFERLNISSYFFNNIVSEPYLHPQKALSIFIDNMCIGTLGAVHPDVLEKYAIKEKVFIFDLDFDRLLFYALHDNTFSQFSRQPAIYRDIALIVDENVLADTLNKHIKQFNNKLITEVTIFDCFTGGTVPRGKKSLAFRIKFQSLERTLTDTEINKIHDKLVAHIVKETGAQLRQ